MNETYVREKLRDCLKGHGFGVMTVTDGVVCSRCGHVVVPQAGLPDISVFEPGATLFDVEVKILRSGDTTFSFSEISEKQRETLTKIVDRGDAAFVALGIVVAGCPRDSLAAIYLVPWREWLAVEDQVTSHQGSIPLVAKKGTRRALQDGKLDIVHLLKQWELEKLKKGWGIPESHPAYLTLNLGGQS